MPRSSRCLPVRERPSVRHGAQALSEHDDLDPEDEPDDTVVDPRDVLKLLLASNEKERDALLERYAGSGKVEKEIIRELANPFVLADVAGFEVAHRRVTRAGAFG